MATAPDLTCQELVELVTAYLDDALTLQERARFEAHLALCAGCQNYVEQLRETIRLTGTLTEAALRPQAREDLLGAFRAWREGRAGDG